MNDHRFEGYCSNLYAVSLIAGPLILLGSSLFHLSGGGMDSDDVGGAVQILAFFFLIFASLGLTHVIAPRRPGAALTLRVLLVFGCVYGAINGLGSALADAAGAGITSLPPVLAMLLVYPGILYPLSLLVTGLVLWGTRAAPAPAGIMLAIGGLLFPVGRIPDIVPLYFVADGLLVLSMGWIGLRLLHAPGSSAPHPAGLTPSRSEAHSG